VELRAPETVVGTGAREAEPAVARVIAIVTALGTTAVVAGFPSALDTIRERPFEVALFLALALVFQLLSFEVYGKGTIGISAIAMLAAGIALGPGVAMLVAVVAAASHSLRRHAVGPKAIFDAANLALAAGAAALVYLPFQHAGSTAVYLAAATVAGGVYMVVNNGLLCVAMATAESATIKAIWHERFHWARYHFLGFGPFALALTVAYERMGVAGVVAFALPPVLTAVSVREYLQHTRSAVEEVRAANELMRRAHRDTIAALTRSMSAKDGYTGGHTERVAEIAVALGRRLGYRGDDLEALEIGALLHDIGKIGVPEHILSKPGPLSADEWATMKKHPVISDYILAETALHPFVRAIARFSHERYDGDGYPDGLAGEDIPLPARIVFVADAYDALTSDRPYRRRRAAPTALDELRRCSGTQFCPAVVEALEGAAREERGVLGLEPTDLIHAA
jgi:riboflavin transporter FmnP